MKSKIAVLFLLLALPVAQAGSITKGYTFTDGGVASASQVNGNFDQLFTEMNAKETRITTLESGGGGSQWTTSGSDIYFNAGKVTVGSVTASDEKFAVASGMYVDYGSANAGTVSNALRFGGNSSGQAIGSKGTAGGNQYGLDFYTGYNPRLSITSGGLVGIGTTTPTASLHIVNYSANGGIIIQGVAGYSNGSADLNLFNAAGTGQWDVAANNTTGNFALWDSLNGKGPFSIEPNTSTNTFYIKNTGNVGIGTANPGYKLDVQGGGVNSSGGYTSISDGRLKTSVQPLADSLEKILRIQGVSFRWIDEKKYGSEEQIGVIAQDLEKVFPDLVKTGTNGLKAVNYQGLIAPAIEAIKAEHQEISQLKKQNSELQAQVKQLRGFLCAQKNAPGFCP